MGLLQMLKLPPPPTQAAPPKAPKPQRVTAAAEGWRQTHATAHQRIVALRKAVQAHYAGGPPDLLREIDKGLDKLDRVLDTLDTRLADALAQAGAATEEAERKAQLAQAKSLLAQYIGYVKSEPLIVHMDNNPFGIKTDLKALLAAGLTDAAKAIG